MRLIRIAFAAGLICAAAPLAAQPAETVRPDEQPELQWAAGVTKITPLAQVAGDAGLFGITGGDPAMNGLTTYISFFESPAEGHKVFRIGDFLDYSVLSQARGRVVLSVRENYMRGRNDAIAMRWRRLTISWRIPAGQQVPASITIASTPGR